MEVAALGGLTALDLSSLSLTKSYSQNGEKETWKLLTACVLYGLVPVVMVVSLRYNGVGNTNVYWNLFSTMLVYFVAITYFKEKITGVQMAGVAMAIGGIYLINASSPEK